MEKQWSSFVSLPNEEILVATRKHWLTLVAPIFLLIVIALFFMGTAFVTFIGFSSYPLLFIAITFLIIAAGINLLVKTLTDWYFHLYIVTTRKILEMSYTPLFSYLNNHVLLDQVRCTEIDVRMGGLLNELMDMGSIAITFDRPTHQEEFLIENVRDPKSIGRLLGDILVSPYRRSEQTVWFKQKEKPHWRNFTDDIFPNPQIGV